MRYLIVRTLSSYSFVIDQVDGNTATGKTRLMRMREREEGETNTT